jgi:hypothetical protein
MSGEKRSMPLGKSWGCRLLKVDLVVIAAQYFELSGYFMELGCLF